MLLGLAAALVGALGVAGCSGSPGPGPAPAPAVDVTSAAITADQLDDLYRQITGGVQQRLSGDIVVYRLTRDATAACMTGMGARYYAPPFATAYEGRSDNELTYGAGVNDGWLARLSGTDLGVAKSRMNDAATRAAANQEAPEVAAMSPTDRAAYDAQLAKCTPAPAVTAGKGVAASADGLEKQLDAVVVRVLAQPDVARLTSGYATCLSRAGYRNLATPAALVDQVASRYPPADQTPGDPTLGNAAWKAAVAAEAKAAGTDLTCRHDAYVTALVALGPGLAKFRQEQAAALSQVTAEWNAIVQAAAAAQN